MLHVSAWVPWSDILTPTKTIAELKRAGIGTAVLMINDYSGITEPTPFRTGHRAALVAMAAACEAAELEVQLCSWAMPHEVFVDGAIAVLPGLIRDTKATRLIWDAEEPWTEAAGPIDRVAATNRLAEVFDPFDTSVTAIGSAPEEVRPLADLCSVWVPQCYATKSSQAKPDAVVPYSLKCWRDRYGSGPTCGWMIGLAAYEQDADPVVSMLPPIDDVLEADVADVCYWTSRAIASRLDVVEFIAALSRPLAPHPGIFPTVDLRVGPSASASQTVRHIQGLLQLAGRDPGKVDGKPGPKTKRAVERLQRARGLPVTGVVDGATWLELLRA